MIFLKIYKSSTSYKIYERQKQLVAIDKSLVVARPTVSYLNKRLQRDFTLAEFD